MKIYFVESSENDYDSWAIFEDGTKKYYKAIIVCENREEYEDVKRAAKKDPAIRKMLIEGRVRYERDTN